MAVGVSGVFRIGASQHRFPYALRLRFWGGPIRRANAVTTAPAVSVSVSGRLPTAVPRKRSGGAMIGGPSELGQHHQLVRRQGGWH